MATAVPPPFAALGDNRISIPLLVEQLRSTGGVIPFVGAGLSVPFGFPGWRNFLLSRATDEESRGRIEACLATGDYEKAAEVVLESHGANALQDAVDATFGRMALGAVPANAAARRLPGLSGGPVLTTNFDEVIEHVFAEAAEALEVVVGMKIDELSRAIHQRNRVLIHLHGLARDRTDRVLTLTDYRAHYGHTAPLEGVLELVMVQPLLFLGCSLDNDRPVRALRALARNLEQRGAQGALRHFAVLAFPEDPARLAARVRELSQTGITPIWYPEGRYELVDDLLAYLVAQRNTGTPEGVSASERYTRALLASFRLDGAGLAVDGASGHALAIAQAYGGMRYALGNERLALAELATRAGGRIVLLGDPGSGKSVTLKRMLAQAAVREGGVPVYLRLADFAAGLPARGDVPVERLLQAFADAARAIGVEALDRRAFEDFLARERLTIGLDGFDEIGSRILRERIAAAIGALGDTAPAARLIVASRPAEYAATPLPRPTIDGIPPFVTATALPLDGDQARGFLKQCFSDDGTLWGTIRRDGALRELARTPLLLTLLALLGRRGPLPAGGPALYDAVVDTALDTWESAKAGGSNAAARAALEELALAMHRRDTPAAPLPQSQAQAAVGSAGESMVDWLVRRSGLLVRHEQRGATTIRATIQVAHLQLQEYLAGCALARRLEAPGDTGWALVKKWGTESAWASLQRFAAAELARRDSYAALERWVNSRLRARSRSDHEGAYATLLTAGLLAEADAHPEFLPAAAAAARLVRDLDALTGSLYLRERVAALCALAPRPAALAAVREIALQTAEGLRWLGRSESLPGASTSTQEEEAVAACIRVLCAHGDPADARQAVDWALGCAWRLSGMAEWASLAGAVERLYGAVRTREYLATLARSDQWLMDAASAGVVALLDQIEFAGHRDLARELAFEGALRGARTQSTAGFAHWLEIQGDEPALAAADAYFDRLRETIERSDPNADWSSGWGYLPLWPDRDSAAVDALRRAVLRQPHVAWHVVREAIRDPRYFADARIGWLEIVRGDPDISRRRGLVGDMIREPDTALSVPLLLDALERTPPDRWFAQDLVNYLADIGYARQVRERLERAADGPSAAEGDRSEARWLIEFVQSDPPKPRSWRKFRD